MSEDFRGRALGGYQIGPQLRQSLSGTVFEARRPGESKPLELTVLFRPDGDPTHFLSRFHQLVPRLTHLQHPNVLGILDFGEAEGQVYIVTPAVSGGPLGVMTKRPLPLGQAADLAVQLGAALDYVHRKGLVHRGVDLDNIMVTKSGRLFLANFLSAPFREVNPAAGATEAAEIVEPRKAEAPDLNSDISGFASLLCELATGLPLTLIEGPNGLPIIVGAVAKGLRGLPQPVRKVLERAIDSEPSRRYPAAWALAADFRDAVAGSLLPATKAAVAPPVVKKSSQGWLPLLLLLVAGVSATACLAGFLLYNWLSRSTPETIAAAPTITPVALVSRTTPTPVERDPTPRSSTPRAGTRTPFGTDPFSLNSGDDFGGTWLSMYGEMNLEQDGSHVVGTYEFNEGRVEGTVADGVLRGTWTESGDSGDFEFEMGPGGINMFGRWRSGHTGPWEEDWYSVRVTP